MHTDDYARVLQNLYALERRGVKLELTRVRDALEALGRPDTRYRIIHVAGTNGKGSVCAMLASCLRKSGSRVGLFTSPHLHRFVERIDVDGEPLDDQRFVRAAERVLALETKMSLGLSFFESAFLIACEAFAEADCEWVVLETGLGGRLDATNVVMPVASVITDIALDHTKILGSTHEAIAKEKAGIVKAGVPLIHAVSHRGARNVVEKQARELGVHLRAVCEADLAQASAYPVALHGAHQTRNAAIVLKTLERLANDQVLRIEEAAIAKGLAEVHWPGRVEVVEGSPTWIFDAAHNPAGCDALARYLSDLSPKPAYLLFGAMADKEHDTMLALLEPTVSHVVICQAPMERAAHPDQVRSRNEGETTRITDPLEAMRWIERHSEPADTVVACGSIFTMALVRAARLGLESDPPIRM